MNFTQDSSCIVQWTLHMYRNTASNHNTSRIYYLCIHY